MQRFVAAACVVVAAGVPLTAPRAQGGITEIRRYGHEEPADAGRVLTAEEARYGGGTLGQVVGIAEAGDGCLYVLDAQWSKVVVFEPDGGLRRVIGLPKGAGPGEVDRPRALALSARGELLVLDGLPGRVVVLDTAGAYRRTMTLGTPTLLHLFVAGDRLYISKLPLRPGAPAVLIYTTAGEKLGEAFVPPASENNLARGGDGNRFAMLDGHVAVLHIDPGKWTRVEAATSGGIALVAQNTVRPLPRSRAVASTASIRGAVQRSDGTTIMLYAEREPGYFEDREPRRIHLKLAVVSRDGTVQGVQTFPPATGPLLASSQVDGEFFVVALDPFPQVVRARLGGR